ncbi:MAG: hypothetical protein ACREEB_01500, partial [Caulobacteraceae bacterium]
MRPAGLFALAFACPTLALAAGDAQDRLDARAEACITAGAPAVVKANADLSSAVEFLTNDLCARDIEVAQKYGLNRRLLESQIENQKNIVESARQLSVGVPRRPLVRPVRAPPAASAATPVSAAAPDAAANAAAAAAAA